MPEKEVLKPKRVRRSAPAALFTLSTCLSEMPGVGEKRWQAFQEARLFTVIDLLRIAPRRYEDRTRLLPLSALLPSSEPQGVFRARLAKLTVNHFGFHKCVIYADFEDSSGVVRARWFNQPYLAKSLIEGKTYYLFGREFTLKGVSALDNPELEVQEDDPEPGLTPVYPSSRPLSAARLSPKQLRSLIKLVLKSMDWGQTFPDLAPESPFPKIRQAFEFLHRPPTLPHVDQAKNTLAFLDQVLFQMGVLLRREKLSGRRDLPSEAPAQPAEPGYPLPFELTGDQKLALGRILLDLATDKPMNRLLQGDVGSGKTLVAFLAMRRFAERLRPGDQCAMMAPTEPLARQHFQTFLRFFPECRAQSALLTGETPKQERKALCTGLNSGEVRFLFGTHALFQEKVDIPRLGFCLIDEQQRFGVEHRRSLLGKSRRPEYQIPHLLLISATPIPRSLSLTLFGDLDLSIIREKPPGRQPILTQLIVTREQAFPDITRTLDRKAQVYYLCPLISASGKTDWASVEERCLALRAAFPNRRIERLTGKDPVEQKTDVLARFARHEIDILVATTIIEVGIDHPNASLMVIENAERFGLSQLHQLRGRVGRGTDQASCLLITAAGDSSERLQVLVKSEDGFVIAMEDLRLRGAGDLVGVRQSGLSHPAFASIDKPELIERARKRAHELLDDPNHETRDWFLAKMRESFGPEYLTFMDGG